MNYTKEQLVDVVNDYVNNNTGYIPDDALSVLVSEYGGDPEKDYTIHRGLNLSESDYLGLQPNLTEGVYHVLDGVDSASMSKSVATEFALMPKAMRDNQERKQILSELSQKERVAQYRGVLMSASVKGDQFIDVSALGISGEAEVLLLPNQELAASFEVYTPYHELVSTCSDISELYTETGDDRLREYIYKNHALELNERAVQCLVDDALEGHQRSLQRAVNGLMSGSSNVEESDGYRFSLWNRNSLSGEALDNFTIVMDSGNVFTIETIEEWDRFSSKYTHTSTYIKAHLPNGLISLYESGALSPSQKKILTAQMDSIVDDTLALSHTFDFDRLNSDLSHKLSFTATKEKVELLKSAVGSKSISKLNELSTNLSGAVVGRQEIESATSQFSELLLSAISTMRPSAEHQEGEVVELKSGNSRAVPKGFKY